MFRPFGFLGIGIVLLSGQARTDTLIGTAKVDITPEVPLLLAGYGHRVSEHEGVDDRLWARAIAIGDEEPCLVIAVDNCGVTAPLVERVEEALRADGIARERLVISSSHTHTAPNLIGFAPVMWAERMTPAQTAATRTYTEQVVAWMIEVGRAALESRRPASLAFGQGIATFGGNRRVLENGIWRGFGFSPDAPVDHSVPVLVAKDEEGEPIAIWSSYTCHCTTMGGRNRISGDWTGYANRDIEARFRDALSLVTVGCGADVGPQPAGDVDMARSHGAALAEEVARLVSGELQPLAADPVARLERFPLPLTDPPEEEHWRSLAERDDFYGVHARSMLKTLEAGDKLDESVEMTCSVWQFGKELTMVFLAGEVVVDYAVRLKTELDWRRVWIHAYSHDVPCYIPSRRVLKEGGYEADFSMIFYGKPARFDPALEDLLISRVKRLVGGGYEAVSKAPNVQFQHPKSSARFPERLKAQYQSDALSPKTRSALARIRELSESSREGYRRLIRNDGEQSLWHDYSGASRNRYCLRQMNSAARLEWETESAPEAGDAVFVFLGGLGWQSETDAGGWLLDVNGREVLRFDLSREPVSWVSEDGAAELHYLPTWTSGEDSAGLFQLKLAEVLIEGGEPVRLSVRPRGASSRRWFALDKIEDSKSIEHMIVEASR
ncbi:MAG: neutral/alkaline non-lysosomal ceramidase N-terminal domain-containing protein [Planctomycetota bacterium]